MESAAQTEIRTRRAPNLVAIVGRPNVGKSTLFNRLIGERRSIVGDEPGITRDRIYGQVDWAGTKFSLIDTGGIVPDDDAVIPANILKQAGVAIEEAQVLIWVVDARTGVTQLDVRLQKDFRLGKKVQLSLFADALNLINDDATQSMLSTLVDSSSFWFPSEPVDPRRHPEPRQDLGEGTVGGRGLGDEQVRPPLGRRGEHLRTEHRRDQRGPP